MASRCCSSALVALQLVLLASLAHSLPFVIFHGIDGSCDQITDWTKNLTDWSGTQGYCVEIGNGALDSMFMPMQMQVDIACENVKQMPELSGGYNLIGISQGSLIARGVIEFCDEGPPIKNYVSIGGVHAGVAASPFCQDNTIPNKPHCPFMDSLEKALIVYSECAQELVSPAGYLKLPTQQLLYLLGCKFLPKLNNEHILSKNSTYKERFESLENLVLIKFLNDNVLIPRETSWFGFYADGDDTTVLPYYETQLYKEDWIGLKTLNEAGKVKFESLPGGHIQVTPEDLKKLVVPYLVDHQAPTYAIM